MAKMNIRSYKSEVNQKPTPEAYIRKIQDLKFSNKLDGAEQIIEEIKRNNVISTPLANVLIDLYCSLQDYNGLMELFDKMCKYHLLLRNDVLNRVLREYAFNDIDTAFLFLTYANQNECIIEPQNIIDLLKKKCFNSSTLLRSLYFNLTHVKSPINEEIAYLLVSCYQELCDFDETHEVINWVENNPNVDMNKIKDL